MWKKAWERVHPCSSPTETGVPGSRESGDAPQKPASQAAATTVVVHPLSLVPAASSLQLSCRTCSRHMLIEQIFPERPPSRSSHPTEHCSGPWGMQKHGKHRPCPPKKWRLLHCPARRLPSCPSCDLAPTGALLYFSLGSQLGSASGH